MRTLNFIAAVMLPLFDVIVLSIAPRPIIQAVPTPLAPGLPQQTVRRTTGQPRPIGGAAQCQEKATRPSSRVLGS